MSLGAVVAPAVARESVNKERRVRVVSLLCEKNVNLCAPAVRVIAAASPSSFSLLRGKTLTVASTALDRSPGREEARKRKDLFAQRKECIVISAQVRRQEEELTRAMSCKLQLNGAPRFESG